MQRWYIEDDAVIEALRQNGFTCEKPQPKLIPEAIYFHTRTAEEEQASRWYETDCPIEWGKSYTLPDGRVLVSHGTSLELQEEE